MHRSPWCRGMLTLIYAIFSVPAPTKSPRVAFEDYLNVPNKTSERLVSRRDRGRPNSLTKRRRPWASAVVPPSRPNAAT